MSAQPQQGYSRVTGHADGVGVVHQALRREVNEHISSLNHDFSVRPSETIAVICECIRASCTANVEMTVPAYDEVRRFPTRFVVKEGHEIGDGERVVDTADGYVVIELTGSGGLYAVGVDPRRRNGSGRTIASS